MVELEISYSTLDQLAGWTDTYATKLLAEEPKRHLGPMSLDAILGATGLKLALIEDPAKLEKARRHRDFMPRKSRKPATSKQPSYVVQRKTREQMRNMASEGGRARSEKLSTRKLSATARKAAKARWRKPRLIEVKSAP